MKKSFLLLFLVGYFWIAQASTVRIYGSAPQYAGLVLEFQRISNPITLNSQTLGSCLVDATGQFNLEFELDSVSRIIVPLEANNGVFFAEPGKSYQLRLPTLRKKTFQEKRSPFFRPTTFLLKIQNQEAGPLNNQIAQLDSIFYSSLQKNLNAIFMQHSRIQAENIKQMLDRSGQDCTLPFFVNYRQYRKDYLDCILQAQANERNVHIFLSQQPVLINNPAYIEVFRLLSKDFMKSLPSNPNDKSIEQLIGEGSFKKLQDNLISRFHFSQEVSGLFILQNLYDGYYTKDYSQEGALSVIKGMSAEASSPLLNALAKDTYNTMTWLAAGSSVPVFSLPDQNGQKRSIDEFKGKYVYLNFIATDDYSCKEHFKVLLQLATKYSSDLTIVSISIDEDFLKASAFFKQKGYQWTLLNGSNNQDLLRIFRVKAIPRYLLINRDGKILTSEALSPYENFAAELNSLLKQEHFNQLKGKN